MKHSSALLILFLIFTIKSFSQDKVKVSSINFSSDSTLHWTIENDEPGLMFTIQQFRWNKWKDLDSVRSMKDLYFRDVKKYFISNENKFRVKVSSKNLRSFSETAKIKCSKRQNTNDMALAYSAKKHVIDFGRPELYEIYDKNGILLRSGFSQTIEIKDLRKDVYYLNYSEITTEFIVR